MKKKIAYHQLTYAQPPNFPCLQSEYLKLSQSH